MHQNRCARRAGVRDRQGLTPRPLSGSMGSRATHGSGVDARTDGRLRTLRTRKAPPPGRGEAFEIDRDRFRSTQSRRSHSSREGVNGKTRFPERDRSRPKRPRRGAGDMFAEQIRAALPGTPRVRLAELAAAVWKGFACGAIAEDDAQQLADEIHARKAIPPTPAAPRKPVGSRPRSPAHMERRRRWTGSGWLPPQLAARFTMAETAVLSTIAAEVARRGLCRLTIGHIAVMAGVSRTTVQDGRQAGCGARHPDVGGMAAHGLAIGAEHGPDQSARVARLAADARPEAGRADTHGRQSRGVGSDPRAPFGLQILLVRKTSTNRAGVDWRREKSAMLKRINPEHTDVQRRRPSRHNGQESGRSKNLS